MPGSELARLGREFLILAEVDRGRVKTRCRHGSQMTAATTKAASPASIRFIRDFMKISTGAQLQSEVGTLSF